MQPKTPHTMKQPWVSRYKILLFLIFLSLPLSAFGAISTDDCLGCHDRLKNFVHGSITCQDCHSDATSLPHKESLAKPSCADCHQAVTRIHSNSIHGINKMSCNACHNAHAADKGKRTCTDCHTKTVHSSLPSRDKHLAAVTCTACHGNAKSSIIKVNIQTKDRGAIKRESIDLDRNNKIDAGEWDHLQALLHKELKGRYSIRKDYRADIDIHGVTKKPQPCKKCHVDRELFGQARLRYTGTVQFEMPVDPSVLLPEIPSIDSYSKTVHGTRGVRCADCHLSLERINDTVCIRCHKDVYEVYKDTVHAQKGATQCTYCHNPHRIETYKELSAAQRLAVCSRCHKDYVQKHAWLPNTSLHFKHLECSTCHSPQSTKSMVFFLGTRKGDKEEALHYEALENIYGKRISTTPLLDKNHDEIIESKELADFFTDVRKRFVGNVFIGSSIIVTNAFHDYSVKRQRERICATCHSDKAPFYESMYFILPENGYLMYTSVKGTILSAAPVSVFIDVSLLGEQKATWSDVRGFFFLKRGELPSYTKELGFKWIDIVGIGLSFITVFFVFIHVVVRLSAKK